MLFPYWLAGSLGTRNGSLACYLDEVASAMGRRLLHTWLCRPLFRYDYNQTTIRPQIPSPSGLSSVKPEISWLPITVWGGCTVSGHDLGHGLAALIKTPLNATAEMALDAAVMHLVPSNGSPMPPLVPSNRPGIQCCDRVVSNLSKP